MTMLSRAGRFWRTVRHLRPVQISNRITRRLSRPRVDAGAPPAVRGAAGEWRRPARRAPSLLAPDRVRFLNREARLSPHGGWNDGAHGKLWLYNLHYFDDLAAFDAEERMSWQRALLERWIAENPIGGGNGWEPYPLSIRISNLVKWFAGGAPAEPGFVHSLALQARWLEQRIEWHLLGNHLFANAKALVLAGLFFDGEEAARWRDKGLRILARELPEQVLPDGGNFERSPMYHALMLEDLLDLLNAASRYPGLVPEQRLADWRETARRMLGWLVAMSHPDGRIALFNDAAFGIAPEIEELNRYAAALGLADPGPPSDGIVDLRDSGYVRLTHGDAVALLDVAPVGPEYLPGHAHADTLSFELSIGRRRFVVNGGTSRYGHDSIRAFERSTAAHSTVEVAGRSSSEVWHGFRVGDRARILGVEKLQTDAELRVVAGHDGYRRLAGAPVHCRGWVISGNRLMIDDRLSDGRHLAIARYIVPPEIRIECVDETGFALDDPETGRRVLLRVDAGRGAVEPAWYGPEFGRRLETRAVAVALDGGHARVTIEWA